MQIVMLIVRAFINVIAAGRRLGKTETIPNILIKAAMFGEGKLDKAGNPIGAPVAFYGPTGGNSASLWRTIVERVEEAGIGKVNHSDKNIKFISGGILEFWSISNKRDVGKSRGRKYYKVVIDEATIIPDLQEAFEFVILPTLLDFIKDDVEGEEKTDITGRCWIFGTARGRDYFYELIERGDPTSEKYDSAYQSHVIPTAIEDEDGNIIGSNNPHMSIKGLQIMKRTMPLIAWQQEFLCKFVDREDTLFKRKYFEQPGRIISKAQMPIGLQWFRYWDLAASIKDSADYTACIAVAHDPDTGKIYLRDLIHERYEVPDAYNAIKANMLGERGLYNVTHGIEKQYVGLGVTQYLDRDVDLVGIGYSPIDAKGDKYTRASIWALYAEQGRIVLVDGAWVTTFLDEVCSFTGNLKFDKHDDIVDSVSGGIIMIGNIALDDTMLGY